nr:DUF2161 family putative PD-(D/E)XK-type phosphodiesterase [Paenibacillus sp. 481]
MSSVPKQAQAARTPGRKETELYAPVKAFFEKSGYEVRAEVRHCDLVAIHPEQPEAGPIVVEMKSTFNLTLVLQALERLKVSTQVYVAVEKKSGSRGHRPTALIDLCKRLGLGYITVTFYKRKPPLVEVVCEPSEAQTGRKPIKTRAARLAREFAGRSGDYNVGGSTQRQLVTAYREKALRVAAALLSEGQEATALAALPSEAQEATTLATLPSEAQEATALASQPQRAAHVRLRSGVSDAAAVLQRNYYGWFLRESRGKYSLTHEGKQALEQYADVVRNAVRGRNQNTPF